MKEEKLKSLRVFIIFIIVFALSVVSGTQVVAAKKAI